MGRTCHKLITPVCEWHLRTTASSLSRYLRSLSIGTVLSLYSGTARHMYIFISLTFPGPFFRPCRCGLHAVQYRLLCLILLFVSVRGPRKCPGPVGGCLLCKGGWGGPKLANHGASDMMLACCCVHKFDSFCTDYEPLATEHQARRV